MLTPRRRGLCRAALIGTLVLTSCGDADEALDPQLRAPATGTYAYDALVYTAEDTPPDTFAGTLLIAVSSEDSIVGTWTVPGYASAARGIWNITAYTLSADPNPPLQGSITHRVWRRNAGSLDCNLTYQHVRMPTDTFTSSTGNSCSLVRSDG